MKTFKTVISEMAATKMPKPKTDSTGKSKVMSGKEAMQHFGKATMNAVMRHPLYKKHIYTSGRQGFVHSVNKVLPNESKYDRHTIHAVTGGEGIRHRVDFEIGSSGRKVISAKHFINKNNERHPNDGTAFAGKLIWRPSD